MEKRRGAILLVLLLLLIAAGWWSVSVYHVSPMTLRSGGLGIIPPPTTTTAISSTTPVLDTAYTAPQSLNIQGTFSAGEQTYSGTLSLPACDTFSTAVSIASLKPMEVILSFEVLHSGGACSVASSTPNPFSVGVSIGATQPTLKSVLINNQPVTFSLSNS